MKYHFYLGFLLFALACEKMDPIPPVLPPAEPEPIDTAYGYPPRAVFNCLGVDTIGFIIPEIPGWKKEIISNDSIRLGNGTFYFVDEMNGFLFQENGLLFKTINGGKTWEFIFYQLFTTVIKASFSSAEHGVIACSNSFSSGGIFFLVTYDGGNTWTQSSYAGESISSVRQIQFIAPDLGYMSAQINNNYVKFYRTVDSARTWIPVVQEPDDLILGTFFAQSRDSIYSANYNSYVSRSIDGGQTWSVSSVPLDFVIDVRFLDANYGVAFSNEGVVVTRNAGNRWDLVSQRPTYFGRFFADGSAVLFQRIKVCNTQNSRDGFQAFVTTNDFGATWKVGTLTRKDLSGDNYSFVNDRCIINLGPDGKFYRWTRL